MKKIKGILLFGILTLLGIGSSFAYNYNFFPVEYFNIDNQYSNYLFNGGSTKNNTFMSLNGGSFSLLSEFFRYNSSTLDDSILNISNYFLTGNLSLNYVSPYLFVENNKDVSLLFSNSRSSYGSYLFRITSGVSLYSSLFSQDVPSFIRVSVNGLDGISSENVFSSTLAPESVRTFVFSPSSVYDSNRGVVNDLTYSGVDYVRGGMAPGVGNEYSFAFSPSISTIGNVATIDSSSIPYYFATVSPTFDGNWQVYKGLFILKLDTLYKKTNTGDFRILAIALTGSSINENTLDFIYSRYSCPSNSFVFSQCSFIDGGYLRSSNLDNSFTSYNGVLYSLTGNYLTNTTTRYRLFQNLLYFLTTSSSNLQGSLSPVIYSVESSNIIQLYRPFYPSAGSFYSLNFSFGLSSSEGINVFDYIDVGGGGNQSTYSGSISLSTCIDTQICYDYTGSEGNIVRMCTTQCVSSGVIASGGYIGSDGTYYFINTPLSLDNLKNSDLTFSTGYLDSGGILDPIYFEDLFDPSKKAVGVCPFPYYSGPLDFLSNIGFDGVYLFMPLICFYSAFQHGAHLSYFDNSNIITGGVLSSPLLGGDSENHRIFFMFLDVLLSIGLLGLFHHLSSLL